MNRKTAAILRLSIMLCLSSVSLLVSSCAVMSKSDCLEGNWREAGNHDALQGQTSEARLSSRIRVCSKHGVTANKVEYLLGYKAGLEHYCDPRRALYAGSNNHTYRGICPADLEQPYLQQYINGLQIARRETWFQYQWVDGELFDARLRRHRKGKEARNQVEMRISRLSNKLDELRSRRHQIDQKIRLWSRRLLSS